MSGEMTRKDKLAQLKRRVGWLNERIGNYNGTSDSYDRAERTALKWAIQVVESAMLLGSIKELEAAATTRPVTVSNVHPKSGM